MADALDAQRAMHAAGAYAGWAGAPVLPRIAALVRETGSASLLDWGCGRGDHRAALAQAIGFEPTLWDPAVPGRDAPLGDRRFDAVICTDVLEHLPDEAAAVLALADMAGRARHLLLVTVCCRPARQRLPDGRNAHLLVRPFTWWAMTWRTTLRPPALALLIESP